MGGGPALAPPGPGQALKKVTEAPPQMMQTTMMKYVKPLKSGQRALRGKVGGGEESTHNRRPPPSMANAGEKKRQEGEVDVPQEEHARKRQKITVRVLESPACNGARDGIRAAGSREAVKKYPGGDDDDDDDEDDDDENGEVDEGCEGDEKDEGSAVAMDCVSDGLGVAQQRDTVEMIRKAQSDQLPGDVWMQSAGLEKAEDRSMPKDTSEPRVQRQERGGERPRGRDIEGSGGSQEVTKWPERLETPEGVRRPKCDTPFYQGVAQPFICLLKELLRMDFDKRQAWGFAKALPGIRQLFERVADLKGQEGPWTPERMLCIMVQVLRPLVQAFATHYKTEVGQQGYDTPEALSALARASGFWPEQLAGSALNLYMRVTKSSRRAPEEMAREQEGSSGNLPPRVEKLLQDVRCDHVLYVVVQEGARRSQSGAAYAVAPFRTDGPVEGVVGGDSRLLLRSTPVPRCNDATPTPGRDILLATLVALYAYLTWRENTADRQPTCVAVVTAAPDVRALLEDPLKLSCRALGLAVDPDVVKVATWLRDQAQKMAVTLVPVLLAPARWPRATGDRLQKAATDAAKSATGRTWNLKTAGEWMCVQPLTGGRRFEEKAGPVWGDNAKNLVCMAWSMFNVPCQYTSRGLGIEDEGRRVEESRSDARAALGKIAESCGVAASTSAGGEERPKFGRDLLAEPIRGILEKKCEDAKRSAPLEASVQDAQRPWRSKFWTSMTEDQTGWLQAWVRTHANETFSHKARYAETLRRLYAQLAEDVESSNVLYRQGAAAFLALLPVLLTGGDQRPKLTVRLGRLNKLWRDTVKFDKTSTQQAAKVLSGGPARIRELLDDYGERWTGGRKLNKSGPTAEAELRRCKKMAGELSRKGASGKAFSKLVGAVKVLSVETETVRKLQKDKHPYEPQVPQESFEGGDIRAGPRDVQEVMQPLLALLDEIARADGAGRRPQSTPLPVDRVMTTLAPWILQLHDTLHKVQRTTSPGPSGLGIAEMQVLAPYRLKTLEDMQRNGFMRLISVLFARMLTGTLTSNEHHYLMTARLIPLAKKQAASASKADATRLTPVQEKHFSGSYPKPGGDATTAKLLADAETLLVKPMPAIRPVACMEQLRRVFDTLLMRALLSPLRKVMRTVQFAVEGDGLGHMIRAVQAAIEDPDAPKETTFIVMDLKNAYNSLSRHKLVDIIKEVAPMLLPYAYETLGQSSRVYTRTTEGSVQHISVTSGVPQGSAMSTLLFALATMGALLAVQSRFSHCGVAAAHDDVILCAPSSEAAMAMAEMLAKYFAANGLQLSRPKTLVYAPHMDLTEPRFDEVFGDFRRVSSAEGFVLLGIPVGHRDWVRHQALDNLRIIAAKWRAIQEVELARRALYGYTLYVMRHHVTYLMRHLSPEVLLDPGGRVLEVDGAMDELFTRLTARQGRDRLIPGIGDKEADMARAMAAMPRRHGGLGMWNYGQLAPIAWMAAMLRSFAFAEECAVDTVAYGNLLVTPWVAQTLARQSARVQAMIKELDEREPMDVETQTRWRKANAGLPSHDMIHVYKELRGTPYWLGATARILEANADTVSPRKLGPDTRAGLLLKWLVALSQDKAVKLQRSWTDAMQRDFLNAISSELAQHEWGEEWRQVTVRQARDPDSVAFFSHRLFFKLQDFSMVDANDIFALAARLRLGAPLNVTMSASPLEERMVTFAGRGNRISLHDAINCVLATILRSAGLTVRREPRLHEFQLAAATGDPPVFTVEAARQALAQWQSSATPATATSSETDMDASAVPPLSTQKINIERRDMLGAPMFGSVTATAGAGAGAGVPSDGGGGAPAGGDETRAEREGPRERRVVVTRRRGDLIACWPVNKELPGGGERTGMSVRLRGSGYGGRQRRRRGGDGHGGVADDMPSVAAQEVAQAHLATWLKSRGYENVAHTKSAIANACILGDTMVQNLWAKTYSKVAAKDPRKALATGEKMKRSKYSATALGFDLEKTLGVRFIPFVVSHMGVLGEATNEFFRMATGWLAAARGPQAAQGWQRYWRRHLSARIVLLSAYHYKRWEAAHLHHKALGGESGGATPAGKMSAISGEPMRA